MQRIVHDGITDECITDGIGCIGWNVQRIFYDFIMDGIYNGWGCNIYKGRNIYIYIYI